MGKKNAKEGFVASPLSIGLLDPKANSTVQRWIEEASPDTRVKERIRSFAATDRQGKRLPRLAEMTVKDLSRPTQPWAEFFGREQGLSASFSMPLNAAAARERSDWIEVNVVHYIRNYMIVALVCMLCVLYKRPMAVVGMAAVAKSWDWLRAYSAVLAARGGGNERRQQVAHACVSIFTWAVLMFSQATTAIFIALFASGVAVCSHAATRRPPGLPAPPSS